MCDFGIVEPEIAGKSAASWRLDRDKARSQRKELKEVFQELEELVEKLKDVDPPDFGSFTDWVQARKDRQRSGDAAGGALLSSTVARAILQCSTGELQIPR